MAMLAELPKNALVTSSSVVPQLNQCRGRASHSPLARGHKQVHTCLWNRVPLVWNVNSEQLCPGLPMKTTFTGGNLTPLGIFSFWLVFFPPHRSEEDDKVALLCAEDLGVKCTSYLFPT